MSAPKKKTPEDAALAELNAAFNAIFAPAIEGALKTKGRPKKTKAAGGDPAALETAQTQSKPTAPAPSPQAARPWREVFKVHPAAEMFPLMSTDELRELADDIEKNGVVEPIVYVIDRDRAPVIVDGRNRMDAMALLGTDTERLTRPGFPSSLVKFETEEAVTAFVISKNIKRRHLTAEQKRDIIAKLLKADPSKSNRSIAKLVDRDDKTVGAVRTQLEATAEIPQLTKTTGADGKARPAKRPSTAVAVRTPEKTLSYSDVKVADFKSEEGRTLENFKHYARDHLVVFNAVGRTEMARRWIAHLQLVYVPSTSTTDAAAIDAGEVPHVHH